MADLEIAFADFGETDYDEWRKQHVHRWHTGLDARYRYCDCGEVVDVVKALKYEPRHCDWCGIGPISGEVCTECNTVLTPDPPKSAVRNRHKKEER